MTLTIAGNWESKGRPPKWVPKFMQGWFTWTKKGSFNESVSFTDRVLLEIGTPVGVVAVAIDRGKLVVLLSGAHELVNIDLTDGQVPFSFSAAGQSVRGLVQAK